MPPLRPAGCTDVDDTLHARALAGGGFEIGVHIADVSHFVRQARGAAPGARPAAPPLQCWAPGPPFLRRSAGRLAQRSYRSWHQCGITGRKVALQ